MDNEPVIHFSCNEGQIVIGTRANTTIYRFFGKLSIYNHIFCVTDKENGRGFYLFGHQAGFERVADYMMDNDYPAYINLRKVAEGDKRAFEDILHKEATTELDGGIPTDWNR